MPVHGRIAGIAGPFIRSQLRGAARYTYSTLRIQDRIIDKTYRKAGLYNRGIVTGIKHGLVAGQVIGGTLNLGLDMNGADAPQNDVAFPSYKRNKKYSRKFQYNRSGYKYNRKHNCCYRRKPRTRYYK